MKITFEERKSGWIILYVETKEVCTKIWTSIVFDPYRNLYIWLGRVRDRNLPATLIIDEEGHGVEFIAERLEEDLIQFRIEPWYNSRVTTTILTATLKPQDLVKAFYDGMVQFLDNPSSPSDWSCYLRNINWRGLVNGSECSQNWSKRIAILHEQNSLGKEVPEFVCPELRPEEKWAGILQRNIWRIEDLARRGKAEKARVMAGFYSYMAVDIALGEIDDSWCDRRHSELQNDYDVWYKERQAKQNKERQEKIAQRDAQLKRLRVGQIVNGVVRGLRPYGIFVDLGNVSALLHVSTISHLPVDRPDKVFEMHEWIRVLIVDMDIERGRISVSTRELEPEPGDMLNNPSLVYERAEEMGGRYRKLVLERMQPSESE